MKKTRKLLSALLCLTMLLPTLVACKSSDEKEIEPAVKQKVTNVYKGTYLSIPENIHLSAYDGYTIAGDRVIFMANELTKLVDQEGYSSRRILYSVPLDGGEGEILPIPQKYSSSLDENGVRDQYANINRVTIGTDNSIVVLEYLYNFKTEAETHLLTRYDANGNEIYSIDPVSYQDIRTSAMAEMYGWNQDYSFYVEDMVLGANGTLYLSTEYSLLAIDANGKKLYELPINGYSESLSVTSSGEVIFRYTDVNDYESRTVYLDDAKKNFSDPIEIPALNLLSYELHMGDGYDFYLQTDTGLYGLNETDAEPTLLCNWVNSDINPNSVQSLRVIDADTFIYVGVDPASDADEIAIMRRVPDKDVPEKYIVRLAGTYFQYDLAGYIVKFNRSNDTYRIVMEDYSEYATEDDYTAGETRLHDEILAGNAPDILYSTGYNSDFTNYADKGVFVDLYTLMEEDTTFDRTNLLPCVLTPFEQDGHLYQLANYFTISGYLGKTKNVGNLVGSFTLDQFLSLLSSCEADGTQFASDMYRDSMERILITDNLSSFIDFDKASCDFNTESFQKILAFLASLPTSEQYYETYDYEEDRTAQYVGLRDDHILVKNTTIASFSDYLQQKAMFLMEDVTLLGNPTSDGGAMQIHGSTTYSVAANSAVKEGAWEFIKYMLSDEVLAGNGEHFRGLDYFCSTKSGIRAMATEEMKHYYTFNLDGSGWGGTTWDGVNVPESEYDPETEIPGYLTNEDAESMIQVLESASFTSNVNAGAVETINQIISEELGAFYAGNSTAADTANKIQSRVSIYLGEHS